MIRRLTSAVTAAVLTTCIWEADAQRRFLPDINGEIKARYEYQPGSDGRFSVRNARLKFNGYVTDSISYRFFLDFNDNGNITILDTYIAAGYKGFEFVAGQQRADLDRSVNPYFFANRSHLIKYMTMTYAVSHDGSVFTNIQGWRDIGIQGSWKSSRFPIRIAAGIFNGSGMSNPVWSKDFTYAARVEIGKRMDGFHFKMWYFNGRLAPVKYRTITSEGNEETLTGRQKIQMGAAGLYYTDSRMYLECEYGLRENDRSRPEDGLLQTGYFQGIYAFRFKGNPKIFKYFAPAFRWDISDGIPYAETTDSRLNMFSGHRFTFGLNLGISEKIMVSELRLNYEHVTDMKLKPAASGNTLFSDKLTLELCVQF